MQMADEDVVQTHEFELHASHGQLCTLAAVNHHQVVAHVEHLARRLVARRHRRATTSQYVQFQPCHNLGLFVFYHLLNIRNGFLEGLCISVVRAIILFAALQGLLHTF